MMHVFLLGLWQSLSARAFRAFAAAGVYSTPGHWAPQHVVSHTLDDMKAQLYCWHQTFNALSPDRSVSEVQDRSLKMLGKAQRPAMDLKAGESKYLMYVLWDVLQKHIAKLPSGHVLAETPRAIREHTDVCDEQPWRMGPAALEQRGVEGGGGVCVCVGGATKTKNLSNA